jgi:regulation of enolase protein 1 (concanavalin A-like superfamily)
MISLVPTVSAQTLSGGWTATNIGSPALAGSVTFNGSVFNVSAAGADIQGTSDQFVFTYRTLAGDGDIVARISSLTNTHAWAKAGVMMRASLAANSAYAAALVSPTSGSLMQYRMTTGANTGDGGRTASTRAPVWLKVQRRGNTVTSFRSTNGTTWTQMTSMTLSLPQTVYVGVAATSHSASRRTTATATSVAALPASWSGVDLGASTLGNSWEQGGAWTSNGAGTDIYNTADQFRFTYRSYTGDVDLVVRLASLGNAGGKAGLMIRGALTANSANAAVLFYGQGGNVLFQSRTANGGSTTAAAGQAAQAPVWLKLTKRGTTITGYQSTDGSNWATTGSQTLSLPSTFYVGLASTSRQASAVASASFTGLSVSVPAASQPPTVSLTAPASGSTHTAPATINIAASAADSDGTVTRVDFRSGSTVIGSDTTSPYTFSWSNVAAGSYSITAVATDNTGASTTSSPVSVTVSGQTGNQAPLVSLTSPADGSSFLLGLLMTITASASDADGSIARVEFYAGGLRLGQDTSSPYSFTWLNLPLGTFSLMAVAYDNDGAMTSSAQRVVNVATSPLSSTAVWVPSPDHSTVSTYMIEVFLAGVDITTANPVATRDVGKPAIINGECSADFSTLLSVLPSGSYVATITAISGGGTARSAPSETFVRP